MPAGSSRFAMRRIAPITCVLILGASASAQVGAPEKTSAEGIAWTCSVTTIAEPTADPKLSETTSGGSEGGVGHCAVDAQRDEQKLKSTIDLPDVAQLADDRDEALVFTYMQTRTPSTASYRLWSDAGSGGRTVVWLRRRPARLGKTVWCQPGRHRVAQVYSEFCALNRIAPGSKVFPFTKQEDDSACLVRRNASAGDKIRQRSRHVQLLRVPGSVVHQLTSECVLPGTRPRIQQDHGPFSGCTQLGCLFQSAQRILARYAENIQKTRPGKDQEDRTQTPRATLKAHSPRPLRQNCSPRPMPSPSPQAASRFSL